MRHSRNGKDLMRGNSTPTSAFATGTGTGGPVGACECEVRPPIAARDPEALEISAATGHEILSIFSLECSDTNIRGLETSLFRKTQTTQEATLPETRHGPSNKSLRPAWCGWLTEIVNSVLFSQPRMPRAGRPPRRKIPNRLVPPSRIPPSPSWTCGWNSEAKKAKRAQSVLIRQSFAL